VFVVGHLGDWRVAAAVLFERESLRGYPPQVQGKSQTITGALSAGAHPGGFNGQDASNGLFAYGSNNTAGALKVASATRGRAPHYDFESETFIACDHFVRRLTPREWERLQGFPDDYTLIPWRRGMSSALAPKKLREPAGIECPDGPRYKALGNSMATVCMGWLGRRIDAVREALA
jgi:DNA (cytosine-5)-methyltransferase 1